MTFVFEKNRRDQSLVPVTEYAKIKGTNQAHRWPDWSVASTKLQVSASFAKRVIRGSTSYTIARTKKRLQEFSLIAGQSAYKGRARQNINGIMAAEYWSTGYHQQVHGQRTSNQAWTAARGPDHYDAHGGME